MVWTWEDEHPVNRAFFRAMEHRIMSAVDDAVAKLAANVQTLTDAVAANATAVQGEMNALKAAIAANDPVAQQASIAKINDLSNTVANTAASIAAENVAIQASLAGSTSSAPTVTVGGSVTAGDTLGLTFTGANLTGSPLTVSDVAVASDTTGTLAAGLAGAVNANAVLQAAGIKATSAGSVVSLSGLTPAVTLSQSVTPPSGSTTSATETLTIAAGS
jgi:biotin carboxyl carrier protein